MTTTAGFLLGGIFSSSAIFKMFIFFYFQVAFRSSQEGDSRMNEKQPKCRSTKMVLIRFGSEMVLCHPCWVQDGPWRCRGSTGIIRVISVLIRRGVMFGPG